MLRLVIHLQDARCNCFALQRRIICCLLSDVHPLLDLLLCAQCGLGISWSKVVILQWKTAEVGQERKCDGMGPIYVQSVTEVLTMLPDGSAREKKEALHYSAAALAL